MKKKIIFDCDNTIGLSGRPMDDALALLYLLGKSDECDIVGICCNFGNGTVNEVYNCTMSHLKEIGRDDIPVCSGSEKGENPISKASRFIVDQINHFPGEVYYLGLGSLGNLYGAYLIDNSIYDKIAQIVLMGGITEPLFIHGNIPLSELNFSDNIEAAVNVLIHGHNISVITGNTCLPVAELPKDEFLSKMCLGNNASGMYIAQKCGYRFKDKEIIYGATSSYCWDVTAAAYLLKPHIFDDRKVHCNINNSDMKSGFLHPCHWNESNVVLNIPVPASREILQDEIYDGWLSLKIDTPRTHYSCNGLYLDKLTQPAVLIKLSKGEAHGFKLLSELKEENLIDPTIDKTGFYRTLSRMEKDGLISLVDTDKRRRKVYSITDFGRQSLSNWKLSLIDYREHISKFINLI